MNKNGSVVAMANGYDQEREDQRRAAKLQRLHDCLAFAIEHGNQERASELSDAILDVVVPCPTR